MYNLIVGFIDGVDDIINLIWRARVVIADLSSKNPNVFYETGIAHTRARGYSDRPIHRRHSLRPSRNSFTDLPKQRRRTRTSKRTSRRASQLPDLGQINPPCGCAQADSADHCPELGGRYRWTAACSLRRQGFALMFVTPNLGLVRRIAQHVAVLAGP